MVTEEIRVTSDEAQTHCTTKTAKQQLPSVNNVHSRSNNDSSSDYTLWSSNTETECDDTAPRFQVKTDKLNTHVCESCWYSIYVLRLHFHFFVEGVPSCVHIFQSSFIEEYSPKNGRNFSSGARGREEERQKTAETSSGDAYCCLCSNVVNERISARTKEQTYDRSRDRYCLWL